MVSTGWFKQLGRALTVCLVSGLIAGPKEDLHSRKLKHQNFLGILRKKVSDGSVRSAC